MKVRWILLFYIGVMATPLLWSQSYPWLKSYDEKHFLVNRIQVPKGYKRLATQAGSFGAWLQKLPLKPGNPPVYLHDGQRKQNQRAHFAVIDIDIGPKNLLQCADAIIRLRAEYLFSIGQQLQIAFNFTSGHKAAFSEWAKGVRPRIQGNNVQWVLSAKPASGYATFQKYLETVFMYAGSYSLSKELVPVKNFAHLASGDVFIQGGFPGHAVIVVDTAVSRKTGERLFLLAQSYMPAQNIHILKNPQDAALSPWYSTQFKGDLKTPEWTFEKTDLKRFKKQER